MLGQLQEGLGGDVLGTMVRTGVAAHPVPQPGEVLAEDALKRATHEAIGGRRTAGLTTLIVAKQSLKST
jgi:hypothetical protein